MLRIHHHAENYDVIDVIAMLGKDLAHLVRDESQNDWDIEIEFDDKGLPIRIIFKYLPPGHDVRTLCAQSAAQVYLREDCYKK
jgi:hypothetical protein